MILKKMFGIIFSTFLLLSFQNCMKLSKDSTLVISEMSSATDDSYFSYPYKTSPDYYEEIKLLEPTDTSTKFSQMTVFVSLAASSGSTQTLQYQVLITNESGYPVCPREEGDLTGGASTIQFNCTASSIPSTVKITVNYGVNAISEHSISKLF